MTLFWDTCVEFLCRHGEKSVKDRISKVFFQRMGIMIERIFKIHRQEGPRLKLPIDKIRKINPFKGKKLFSGKSKKKAAQSTDTEPPGAHSKRKKKRRLKKKVVIPLAVVVVAGGAVGGQYFLNRGDGESKQT